MVPHNNVYMHHSVSNRIIILISTFTILLGVLLTCYKARVTSVEYNKVPEKAYVFTFAELGSF